MHLLSLLLPRRAGALWILLFVLALGATAGAELRPVVAGYRDWANAVSALQSDRDGQGRFLDVSVEDTVTHQSVPCSDYSLQLDPAGMAAFAVDACSPEANVTRVWLRNRAALFDHGDLVPRPRPMTLTVVQVRTARAQGSSQLPAGSDVHCSVAVRPFLRNLETGQLVYLQPGRFILRSLGTNVQASVEGQGWRLETPSTLAATMRVSYEVVDTQRGEVVLREQADLTCARQSLDPGPGALNVGPFADGELGLNDQTSATTVGANQRMSGSCGGSRAPERVFHLNVPERGILDVNVQANFDAVLYVRRGSPNNDALELGCNDDDGTVYRSALQRTVEPGDYFVVVDGYGSNAGAFTLTTRYTRDMLQVLSLEPDALTRSTTVGEQDRYHGACGGGSAPERLYTFTLAQPTQVTAEVSADFSPVLYLRAGTATGPELGCATAEISSTRVTMTRTLPPGVYFLMVDGYHTSGNFTLALHSLRASGDLVGWTQSHLPVALEPGQSATGSTAGAPNLMFGSCGGRGAPEVVYQVAITHPGVYTASVDANYDAVLYLTQAYGGREVACNDDTGRTSHSRVTTFLAPGQYFLVVDGFSNYAGTYAVGLVEGTVEGPFTRPYDGGSSSGYTASTPQARNGIVPAYDWRRPVFDLSAAVSFYNSGTRLGLLYGPTLGLQMDVPITPSVRLFFGPQGSALFGSCTGVLGPGGTVCNNTSPTSAMPTGHVDVNEYLVYLPIGVQLHLLEGWFRPFITGGPALSIVGAQAPYGSPPSAAPQNTLQFGVQMQAGLEIAVARFLRLYGAVDAHLFNVSSGYGTLIGPSVGGELGLRFTL